MHPGHFTTLKPDPHQGSNRLQRGRNYLSYLQSLAPGAVLVNATFAGGHNNSGCFFSDALSRWVLAPSARVARHGTPQLVEDEALQAWAEGGGDTLS